MKWIERVHEWGVFPRRIERLSRSLDSLIPAGSRVLDVGCGDGRLASLLQSRRPDLTFSGIDTLVRPATAIPVHAFDGLQIPFQDKSFDVVMLVDVLHHASHPQELLREAARVATRTLVIKDHQRKGFASELTLRFMDRVGNARYGVELPYNYWTPEQWSAALSETGLRVLKFTSQLGLYSWPASAFFDRSLHVLYELQVPRLSS